MTVLSVIAHFEVLIAFYFCLHFLSCFKFYMYLPVYLLTSLSLSKFKNYDLTGVERSNHLFYSWISKI